MWMRGGPRVRWGGPQPGTDNKPKGLLSQCQATHSHASGSPILVSFDWPKEKINNYGFLSSLYLTPACPLTALMPPSCQREGGAWGRWACFQGWTEQQAPREGLVGKSLACKSWVLMLFKEKAMRFETSSPLDYKCCAGGHSCLCVCCFLLSTQDRAWQVLSK